ncbi:uncharacterized protein SPSC_03590 [Sporisorium scitamineum]|uniref:Uncharacterized protein n=1 Tax=Sporisorium scitamineum TaxID=49012 RepID=A0A140KN99_9BASI|nr:uncharacterized protein SPSC_03590 [Sporisorium scitamineum]
MSNGNATKARQQGADSDGLNLPSFRDLVSFRKADAYVGVEDGITSARCRRENGDVVPSPRGPLEESFEVVAVKRASHHHPHPSASPAQPCFDRQRGHSDYMQDRGGTHPHSHGPRISSRDPREDFSTHYTAREVAHRDHHADARDHLPRDRQVQESYRTGRLEERAPSRQDDRIQERLPTSQEMVRSSKPYQPVISYPSNRLPANSENSIPSDRLRSVKHEFRPVPTQAIPSQGSTAFSRPPPQSPAQDHQRTHGDRQENSQRQGTAVPVRVVPHDKEPYRDYRSVDDLERRSLPSSPQIVDARRAPANSSSLGQTPSPRLPLPRNQGRMFDYSCARLPVESRLQASSASMGPPSSSFRTVHGPTSASSSIDTGRERDCGRQRVLSHPQSQYLTEHGMVYQQRHAVYADDLRVRPASSGDRLSDNVLEGRSHDLERAGLQMVEVMPRTTSSADPRKGDSPLHRDQRSLHAVTSHRGYVPRSSPIQQGRQALAPVKAVPVHDYHSARPSSSDSKRLVRTRDEYERSSLSVVRHPEESYTTRTSHNANQRDFQDVRQVQRERNDVERTYAVQQQSSRAQRSSQSDDFDQRNEIIQESRRIEQDHRYQGRSHTHIASTASPLFPRDEPRMVRASISSPRYGGMPSKDVVGPSEKNGAERRIQATSPRNLVHMESPHQRRDRPLVSMEDRVFSSRGRPIEDYQPARKVEQDYLRSGRAVPGDYEPIPQQAAVHASSKLPPQECLAPATSVYRTGTLVQRPSRGDGDRTHRVSPPTPQLPRLRDRDAEVARSRYPPQAHSVKDSHEHRSSYHDQHPPSAHPSPVAKAELSHNTRALPPVIASQHTSVRPPNVADLKPSAVTPAPPRPLKRLRADSDTSLVLKASRFTVVEAEDDAPRPSFSRVMLPSPPRVTGARESVQRHHLDQSDRPSESRPGSSSESPAKPANGSAPITPPRSST